jgi:hypothetical protein
LIPVTVLAVVAAYVGVVQFTAHAADSLLSQGKPATASSQEGADVAAALAVDGNAGTRWSSQFSDPQWLRVDLGTTATISQVVLQWEGAYVKAYKIQTSADGTTWTDIHSTTTGAGGTETLTVSGTGRYIRMYGTTRASGYGYSLYEFRVFTGGSTTPPTDPTTPPPVPGDFTTVWTDDFSGAANTSPNAANWLLRTGTQYPGGAANWGTGEVETASNSTANVYLDGAGKLNIKAIRDGAGKCTQRRSSATSRSTTSSPSPPPTAPICTSRSSSPRSPGPSPLSSSCTASRSTWAPSTSSGRR